MSKLISATLIDREYVSTTPNGNTVWRAFYTVNDADVEPVQSLTKKDSHAGLQIQNLRPGEYVRLELDGLGRIISAMPDLVAIARAAQTPVESEES